jgi:thioredoxin-like negative regulator of GroEL
MFGFGINRMMNVFYFTADWCQPCKKVKPIVEEMKKEGFNFQMIDVDYEQELVKQFEIKSVPTFILLKEGKEINRITGTKTREELENFTNYEKNTQENA